MNRYRTPSPSAVAGGRPTHRRAVGRLPQPGLHVDVRRAAADRRRRYLVQATPRLFDAARDLFLPAILVELGVVIGIGILINRITALVALGLFFVYAAVNGLTIGLIVSAYTTASVAVAFLSAARHVRCRGGLRRRDEAVARLDGRLPVHGPVRAPHRDARQPLPGQHRDQLRDLRGRRGDLHGAHRV